MIEHRTNNTEDAPDEPEHSDVAIHVPSVDAVACAFTPEVKVEFDRLGQLFGEMKDIQEEIQRGIALNRTAIIITAFLAFIAIVLSVISILLQTNVL